MDVATRNPGAWACPVCTTEFDGESQLQLHMKRIHDHAETKAPPPQKKETKIHTCEARGCHRSFPSLPQLQSHKKNLHPELLVGKKKKKKKKKKVKAKPSDVPSLPLPCPVCRMLSSDVDEHLRIEHGYFRCHLCEYVRLFRAELHFRAHIQCVHPKHVTTEEHPGTRAEAKGHGSSFPSEKTVSTAESPTDHHISAIMDQEHKLQSQMKADNPNLPHPGVVTSPVSMKKGKRSKKRKKKVPPYCDFCQIQFNSTFDLQLHFKDIDHPPSPSISGKSEVIVNQRDPRSVYVMVSFDSTHYGALYEIDLQKLENLEKNEGEDEYTLPFLDPVLDIFDKKWDISVSCILHGARIGSKVFILSNAIKFPYIEPFKGTDAIWFDLDDLSLGFQRFSPPNSSPKSSKIWSTVISAYGKLYYLASPSCFPYIEEHSFQCYDPTKNSWETLPPYPYYSEDDITTQISGYAVLYGYILVSALGEKGGLMTVFHIATKTWHHVRLSESVEKIYDGFWGRAVVLNNMIYAPSSMINEVIAFPFCWNSNENATRSHYLGPLLSLFVNCKARLPAPFGGMLTKRLIHLGRRDFCLIQTGLNDYSDENQYLSVCTFRIVGEGEKPFIQIINSRVFRVAVDSVRESFVLEIGFTLDCSEIEPEEGEQCVTAFAMGESA